MRGERLRGPGGAERQEERARGPLAGGAAELRPSRAHARGPVSGFQHSLGSVTAKEQRGWEGGTEVVGAEVMTLRGGPAHREMGAALGHSCHRWGVVQPCLSLVTPGTVARQAPLSMRFPRQEYRSGMPGDLPDPGVELASPALGGSFFTAEAPGRPQGYAQCGQSYPGGWQTMEV